MYPIDNSVRYLKGIGEQRAKLFAKLDINTVRDLLLCLPTRYEDRRQYKKIAELKDNETVTVSAKIELTEVVNISPKLAVFKAALSDSTGIIYALFYKRPNYRYDVFNKLKQDFKQGRKVIVHGKVEKVYTTKQLNVEEYELLSDDPSDFIHTNRIVPVYTLTEGLNNKFFRAVMKLALENYSKYYPEILSKRYQREANLLQVKDAIDQIHFPDNFHAISIARERLAFDEFLLFELAMIISKRKRKQKRKVQKYIIRKHLLTPFKYNLGFEFTSAQKRTINEIFRDMRSASPMNRLLIGDVGSGKTVVALSAILLAIENGYQAALMAPTEILAEQHFLTIKHFLKGLDVKVELLIGSTQAKLKKSIKEKLTRG
ncbi:MAG: DEAD/DEAH box helicase, partial [Elusimicrobiota bacterium]|nr:DEAD/DEAH box helicase [Elusimicrobiota bacterium]